jgi:esterase
VSAHEHQAIVDGIRLNYLDWPGSREPPMVFLHGAGLSGRAWDAVCATLSPDRRCIAPDQRGHGRSEWSGALAYRTADFVKDVAGLVTHLELDPFVLVGHSMGGRIALAYAAAHHGMVAGLALVDSTLTHRGDGGARFRGVMTSGPFADLDEALSESRGRIGAHDVDSLLRGLERGLVKLPDGRLDWRADQRSRRIPSIAAALDEDRETVRKELLRQVSGMHFPSLVIRGEDSDVVTDAGIDDLVNGLADVRVETAPGAGHNVHRDNPAFLAESLNRFADSLTRRP